jgi:DNA-directed RNA polymerase specialized sigma24 family protein
LVPDDISTNIQSCIDRLRTSDKSARAELLSCPSQRLARMARKMLGGYPGVARCEQGDDVAKNALIRLDRALRAVTPPSAPDFFRLAAAVVRRELIDLARHYYGPARPGAHHASQPDHADGKATRCSPCAPRTVTEGSTRMWSEEYRRAARSFR